MRNNAEISFAVFLLQSEDEIEMIYEHNQDVRRRKWKTFWNFNKLLFFVSILRIYSDIVFNYYFFYRIFNYLPAHFLKNEL